MSGVDIEQKRRQCRYTPFTDCLLHHYSAQAAHGTYEEDEDLVMIRMEASNVLEGHMAMHQSPHTYVPQLSGTRPENPVASQVLRILKTSSAAYGGWWCCICGTPWRMALSGDGGLARLYIQKL